jgi:tetraacyldisaccharide 4'-kinase
MSLSETLQRRWYQDRPPSWWALPVAALYRVVASVRRGLYQRGWKRSERLPAPVIVVGNITVGGAGKTPLVIALVEALRQQGFKPGVVSRGFGGSARGPMLLDDDPDPRVTGDEPALIKLRTRAPVAVGRGRPQAARLLLDEGVDVVIADDGLQHYALARDIEICVVDGDRRFGNARLLPAGPLREPLSRLREMDFVVCNGGEPQAGEIAMRLQAGDAFALSDPSSTRALASFAGQRVHAVAGIGNPARFFSTLRRHDVRVIEHAFADHHAYAARDLRFDDDSPVLMTEKDAVKCRAFAQANWWAVPVRAILPDEIFVRIPEKLVRRAQ